VDLDIGLKRLASGGNAGVLQKGNDILAAIDGGRELLFGVGPFLQGDIVTVLRDCEGPSVLDVILDVGDETVLSVAEIAVSFPPVPRNT
jgi:hypothetical protein